MSCDFGALHHQPTHHSTLVWWSRGDPLKEHTRGIEPTVKQGKPQSKTNWVIFLGQCFCYFFLVDPKGNKILRDIIASSFKTNRTNSCCKIYTRGNRAFCCEGLFVGSTGNPNSPHRLVPDQTAQRTPVQTNQKAFRHARRHHNLSAFGRKKMSDNKHIFGLHGSIFETRGAFAFYKKQGGVPGSTLGCFGCAPFWWVEGAWTSPRYPHQDTRKIVFQSSIFRCELLVSGRVS